MDLKNDCVKYTEMIYTALDVFLFFATDALPSPLAADSAAFLVATRFRLAGVGVDGPAAMSSLVVSVGTGSKLGGFVVCGEELMPCQY